MIHAHINVKTTKGNTIWPLVYMNQSGDFVHCSKIMGGGGVLGYNVSLSYSLLQAGKS